MNKTVFTDPWLLDEFSRFTKLKSIQKDETLMEPGDIIHFVPMVEKGVLRVVRKNEDNQEIFLYHLYPGQTCAMALNCCQSQKKSVVKIIAEENTEIRLIPISLVEDWFKFPEWKAYLNQTYSHRFTELLEVIDLIAFNHMDKQVLHYLQERAKAIQSSTLIITHQQIADELHTRREAISRLLRTMEQKNMLKLGRNTIELNA